MQQHTGWVFHVEAFWAGHNRAGTVRNLTSFSFSLFCSRLKMTSSARIEFDECTCFNAAMWAASFISFDNYKKIKLDWQPRGQIQTCWQVPSVNDDYSTVIAYKHKHRIEKIALWWLFETLLSVQAQLPAVTQCNNHTAATAGTDVAAIAFSVFDRRMQI